MTDQVNLDLRGVIMTNIDIIGAKQNNLKNINVSIPKQLTVLQGVQVRVSLPSCSIL